ncbi:hypothetical protein GGR54DRAFT_41616 [Hypoxylon sp. NC1633]|nr:hypothetical protein GGR54DRAFT_41616 [Hypoxylon sp. NC1633]
MAYCCHSSHPHVWISLTLVTSGPAAVASVTPPSVRFQVPNPIWTAAVRGIDTLHHESINRLRLARACVFTAPFVVILPTGRTIERGRAGRRGPGRLLLRPAQVRSLRRGPATSTLCQICLFAIDSRRTKQQDGAVRIL